MRAGETLSKSPKGLRESFKTVAASMRDECALLSVDILEEYV